jgi:hypothetical protein
LGIESHYWRRNNNPLGYKGPFQYSSDSWDTALVHYKKMNKDVSSSSLDRLNVSHQCKVFANDIVRYQNVIKKKLNIEPEPWMIYMLHQQGESGALHILNQYYNVDPNRLLAEALLDWVPSAWVNTTAKPQPLPQANVQSQTQMWDYAFEAQGAETTWYYMDWATVQVHHWIDAFKAVYDGTRTGTPWRIRSGVPSNPGWFLRERVTTYIEKDPLLLTFGTLNTHELVDAIDELTYKVYDWDQIAHNINSPPVDIVDYVKPGIGLDMTGVTLVNIGDSNTNQGPSTANSGGKCRCMIADVLFRFIGKPGNVVVMQIKQWGHGAIVEPSLPNASGPSDDMRNVDVFINFTAVGVGNAIVAGYKISQSMSVFWPAPDDNLYPSNTPHPKIVTYDWTQDAERFSHSLDPVGVAGHYNYSFPDGYPVPYGDLRMAYRWTGQKFTLAFNGGDAKTVPGTLSIPEIDFENPSREAMFTGRFIIERIEIYPDNDDPLFLKIVSTPGIIG